MIVFARFANVYARVSLCTGVGRMSHLCAVGPVSLKSLPRSLNVAVGHVVVLAPALMRVQIPAYHADVSVRVRHELGEELTVRL